MEDEIEEVEDIDNDIDDGKELDDYVEDVDNVKDLDNNIENVEDVDDDKIEVCRPRQKHLSLAWGRPRQCSLS